MNIAIAKIKEKGGNNVKRGPNSNRVRMDAADQKLKIGSIP